MTMHYLSFGGGSCGKGNLPATYAIIGPAPSPNRPKHRVNEPFGVRSWELLRGILSAYGADNFYLTNLVKEAHPYNKKIGVRLLRKWTPHLLHELSYVRPDRILALGATVASALCPNFQELKSDHGVLFLSPELSDRLDKPVMVVPTYHFAQIGRNPLYRERLNRDLERFFHLPLPEPPKYKVIRSGRVPEFRQRAVVTIDLETTGFNPYDGRILSVGVGVDYSDTCIMYQEPTRETLQALWHALRRSDCTLQGQNFQFDLYWLTVHSDRDWVFPVLDTMTMAHNQGHDSIGLKHLTTMLTDRPGPHAFGSFEDLAYAAEDIYSTQEVSRALREQRPLQFIDEVVHRAIPHVARNRTWGVYIDRPLLHTLKEQSLPILEERRALLNETFGVTDPNFNWNSTKQVVDVFLANHILLTETTDAGAYTLKESVLLALAEENPKVRQLLEYRETEKMLSGFLENYLERTTDEVPLLRPNMKLTGTQTGRTSCVDPNLQQVTRVGPLKLLFKPRWHSEYFARVSESLGIPVPNHPGYYGLIDLSQAELRAACLIAGDDEFAAALLSEDVHRTNAAKVFHYENPADVPAGLRKKVKGVVFGVLYGGSPKGLASRIGVGVEEVEMILDGFFGQFPRLGRWLEEIKRYGIKHLEVTDPFGRRRSLRQVMLEEGPGGVKRKACNTPVQGLASHMSLYILGYVSEHLYRSQLYSRVLFGVHDSTILEIYPTEVDAVVGIVQRAFYGLNNTPLSDLSLWGKLPIVGELILGSSWAAVESTSDYYEPDKNLTFECTTAGAYDALTV